MDSGDEGSGDNDPFEGDDLAFDFGAALGIAMPAVVESTNLKNDDDDDDDDDDDTTNAATKRPATTTTTTTTATSAPTTTVTTTTATTTTTTTATIDSRKVVNTATKVTDDDDDDNDNGETLMTAADGFYVCTSCKRCAVFVAMPRDANHCADCACELIYHLADEDDYGASDDDDAWEFDERDAALLESVHEDELADDVDFEE